MAARGDDAVKFLAAEMNALRFALCQQGRHRRADAPDQRGQSRTTRVPLSCSTTRSLHKAVDPSLPIPAEKIQWLQEQMVKAGNIAKVLDLKVVTAPEYREKALKLVGPNG